MPTVFIAMPLRRFTGGQATVQLTGATLRQIVERLESSFPGIRERLVDADDPDRLAPGLSAIVDGEATVLGLRQPLEPGSEVHFLPAIAGGERSLPCFRRAGCVIPAKAGIQTDASLDSGFRRNDEGRAGRPRLTAAQTGPATKVSVTSW